MESSASDMKSAIFYDEKMTSLITSYNNQNSAYEELSKEKCGVSVNVRNGQKIKAKTCNFNDIGTIYIVDFERIYSIKFKVVEKPYESIVNFDNSNYKLNFQIKDSYGNQLNSTSQIANIKIGFPDSDLEKEINIGDTDIINLPFVKEQQTMSVLVTYTVPKIDNGTYSYTETHSIEVLTETLDMASFSEVSTNKRIILKNTPNENKTIKIGGSIETIIIDSVTSNNIYIDISGTDSVTIIMKNTNLTADTNLNVIKSNGSKTIFYLIEENRINGKITDDKYLVHVNELMFQGNGTLSIIGQAGDHGNNGNSSSINGSNGQKGTNAVFCNSDVLIPKEVNIKGGDGGNGGHGFNQTSTDGNNGGKGGNGGNAGIGISIKSGYSGYAGRGGDGGKGGDGYSGSSARIETEIYGYNGITHNGYSASQGSVGGKGGDAGANGKGNSIDPIYSNPKGGNGGNGGHGGSGSLQKVWENGSTPPPSIVIPFTRILAFPPAIGGAGGNGGISVDGIGGKGGNGGNGGHVCNGIDDNADYWRGYNGAIGGNGGSGGNGNIKGANGYTGTTGNNGAAGKEPSCVTQGTLITLADGTQVAVEDLTGNEMLLVWNLKTGSFDTAPILFIDSDPQQVYEVINLYFSDGTSVKVISEHAFWNIDLNKYFYLRNDAAQYIGHWFNKQTVDANGNMTWKAVQLTNVVVANEITTAWSPVTAEHLCYYVNGMLSMPGGTTGLINIFEVNAETMKYDQDAMLADIEEFGLFTYEEFAELIPVPQEIFDAFDAQYFKVAIGKGLINMEDIVNLIETYAEFLIAI